MHECYPGDDSLAEVVTIRAKEWVRDEGYTVAEVMGAITNAVNAGIGGGGFIRWTRKNLNGSRDRPSESPRPRLAEPEPEFPKVVMTPELRRQVEAMRKRPVTGGQA